MQTHNILSIDNALMAGYEIRISPHYDSENMQLHWLCVVLDAGGNIAFSYDEVDLVRLVMKLDYDLLGTEL